MSNIISIASQGASTGRNQSAPVFFDRKELDAILQVYGRGVAAGEWRDYSIDASKAWVSFSTYRRATEMPDYRIVKEPGLTRKKSTYRILNAAGQVLKRGPELKSILRILEKKLIKVASD